MRKLVFLFVAVLFGATAFAAKPASKKHSRRPTQTKSADCDVVTWPFAKDLKSVNQNTLSQVPRDHLYAFLFGELSKPEKKRVPGLAPKLMWYLKNSEPNTNKMTMVEALELAYLGDDKKVNIIPQQQLCSMWAKVQ